MCYLCTMTMTTPISIAVTLLYLSVMVTLTKTTVPEILIPPENQTVVAGTRAVFKCTVKGGQIDFFVNGSIANEGNVKSKGFSMSTVMSNGDNKSLSLEAIGHESNNQTEIKCRAMNTAGQSQLVYSDKVLLYIQGPLDRVVDLSCSFINSSAAKISWIPPFTLPNTTIDGYNISITSYEEEIAKDLTSHTSYLLTLSNKTNSFNVTVAAYNGLNGAIAEIPAHSCSEAVPSSSVFTGSNSDDFSEPHDSPVITEPKKITTIDDISEPHDSPVIIEPKKITTIDDISEPHDSPVITEPKKVTTTGTPRYSPVITEPEKITNDVKSEPHDTPVIIEPPSISMNISDHHSVDDTSTLEAVISSPFVVLFVIVIIVVTIVVLIIVRKRNKRKAKKKDDKHEKPERTELDEVKVDSGPQQNENGEQNANPKARGFVVTDGLTRMRRKKT